MKSEYRALAASTGTFKMEFLHYGQWHPCRYQNQSGPEIECSSYFELVKEMHRVYADSFEEDYLIAESLWKGVNKLKLSMESLKHYTESRKEYKDTNGDDRHPISIHNKIMDKEEISNRGLYPLK